MQPSSSSSSGGGYSGGGGGYGGGGGVYGGGHGNRYNNQQQNKRSREEQQQYWQQNYSKRGRPEDNISKYHRRALQPVKEEPKPDELKSLILTVGKVTKCFVEKHIQKQKTIHFQN
jgi:hypothetical protein